MSEQLKRPVLESSVNISALYGNAIAENKVLLANLEKMQQYAAQLEASLVRYEQAQPMVDPPGAAARGARRD